MGGEGTNCPVMALRKIFDFFFFGLNIVQKEPNGPKADLLRLRGVRGGPGTPTAACASPARFRGAVGRPEATLQSGAATVQPPQCQTPDGTSVHCSMEGISGLP